MAARSVASRSLQALGLRLPALSGFARQDIFQTLGSAAARTFSSVEKSYKYNASHEWASVDGDFALVGISDHAQAELGDVVYVELPEVGKAVKKGETFGVVESVKAASDVYSPVSGEVVEVNSTLVDTPATVNKDPYKSGWIIKVKLSNKGELASLMDAEAYEKASGAAH